MKKHTIIQAAAAATALALVLCGCFCEFPQEQPQPSPVITQQPSDIRTRADVNVTFETFAKGKNLSYQWYYKKSGSPGWSVWKKHTSPKTFATANSSWNGMRVYCRITDQSGSSVATRAALISLEEPPVITSQPRSVTVNLGETAYFRVRAEGRQPLKYQWYYQKSNSTFWTKWRGHTLPETEAVSNNSWNGMRVYCLVTDSTGGSVSSAPATVTVTDSPSIISQPQKAAPSRDGSASFSVQGGTEGLHYQWFYVPPGNRVGIRLLHRNEPQLSLSSPSLQGGVGVYCRVSCPGGNTVISEQAALLPAGTPLITLDPQSTAAKAGERMRFSVKANGDGLQYQWYLKNRNPIGWSPLREETGDVLILPATKALSGSEVRCRVTDSDGHSALSQPAEITVNDKIGITLQPKDTTVGSGEPVVLRVATQAGSERFQWYSDNGNGFGWKKLPGQTGSVFSGIADSSWHGRKLRCVVTSEGCPPVFSRVAVITVNDTLTLKASPENISARSGDTVHLTAKATGRGLKYQWMRMADRSREWDSWQGQTAASLRLSAERSWHRMKVRCDIADCTGKTISSDSAYIWIKDALDILRQPRNITVRAYEPAMFSVTAQGEGLHYRWYYRKKGMTRWHLWKNHTTASTSAISNPSWEGMRVMCVITDAHGARIASKASVVRITE